MTTTTARTEVGCDRCGVDDLGRPIRMASHRVQTSSGDVHLCRSHLVAHSSALAAYIIKQMD